MKHGRGYMILLHCFSKADAEKVSNFENKNGFAKISVHPLKKKIFYSLLSSFDVVGNLSSNT